MGPQHIRDGVLGVRQQKTGIELAIPVHSTLAAVIAETPTYHLTFLTNQFGRPFTASYFGQWFREQCDMRACTIAAPTASVRPLRAAWPRRGVHRPRDRGHYRPRQPEGGGALYPGCRPHAARAVSHCQTRHIE